MRVLTRLRVALEEKLHEVHLLKEALKLVQEFSVWWREGKVPLPTYTQRRVEFGSREIVAFSTLRWWDRKPPLPFELQIQSRCKAQSP